MRIESLKDLEKAKRNGIKSLFPKKPKFRFGKATCGMGAGIGPVIKAMDDARVPEKIGPSSIVGCIGACYAEPLVELYIPRKARVLYKDVDEDIGKEIMKSAVEGRIKEEHVFCKIERKYDIISDINKKLRDFPAPDEIISPFDGKYLDKVLEKIPSINDLEYYRKQEKIVLRNSGYINPEKVEEYIAEGGYTALYKALKVNPKDILEKVSKSKLRGRGGAGFLTGKKWKLAEEAEGETKYVVSNGDEGDPGAYMDRVVLESDPHSMIEGMIIGAYAIGAEKGFVFVRNEYPKAVERLEVAIQQAEELGILGRNIMGSGFDFDIDINRGGGAFVCGEETALMSVIEGKLPCPRPRPPYPTESGLWGDPTLINNVKSWANIPVIISRGRKFFVDIGTERSGGTKVFSLVGDVNRRGLIEVKFGTPIKDIISLGIEGAGDGKIKAVQTGGPSGGFIPTEFFDVPLDFENLAELGSIMGSGGLVVVDESSCMVDLARYFLEFTSSESCGQCTPCREGLERLLEILNRITKGEGKKDHIELIRELSEYVKNSSLCALGGTAPNPVLSTLDNFEEEYREHIEDKFCRAEVCDLKGGKG